MFRRIVLVITGLLLFIAIVGSAVSFSFARNGPHLPGAKLFSQQLTSEQVWKVRLIRPLVPRADSVLDLFEKQRKLFLEKKQFHAPLKQLNLSSLTL